MRTLILFLALSASAAAVELTDEQRAILGYVVVDPQAWADHAVEALGPEAGQAAIRAKVERWRAEHEAALMLKITKGEAYKSRAERDAEARAADDAETDAQIAADEAAKDAALRELIAEEIAKQQGAKVRP